MAREGLMPSGGDIDAENRKGENELTICRGEKENSNFLVFIIFINRCSIDIGLYPSICNCLELFVILSCPSH